MACAAVYTELDPYMDYDLVGEPYCAGSHSYTRETWACRVSGHLDTFLRLFPRGGQVDRVNKYGDYTHLIYNPTNSIDEFDLRFKFQKFCEMFPPSPCGLRSKTNVLHNARLHGHETDMRSWTKAAVHDFVYDLDHSLGG